MEEVQNGQLAPGAPLPSIASNSQVQTLLQQQAQSLQQFQQGQVQQRQEQVQSAQTAQAVQQGLHELQVVDRVEQWQQWPYHSWGAMATSGDQNSVNANSIDDALQQAYAPFNQDQALVTNYLIAQETAAAAGKNPNQVSASDISTTAPQV